jgi:hypothetical protein
MALAALNHRLDAFIEAIPEDKETRINTVPADIQNMYYDQTYNPQIKEHIVALADSAGLVRDVCSRMFGSDYVRNHSQSGIRVLCIFMPFFKQTDDIPFIKTWASEDRAYRFWKMDQPPPADWINRLAGIKYYTYESINATLNEAAGTITISLKNDAREFVFTRHSPTNALSKDI